MLAQSKDAAFQVQVCHQRVNSHVSVNRGVAIKSAVGTIKYVGGVWILPTGAVAAGVTRSGFCLPHDFSSSCLFLPLVGLIGANAGS